MLLCVRFHPKQKGMKVREQTLMIHLTQFFHTVRPEQTSLRKLWIAVLKYKMRLTRINTSPSVTLISRLFQPLFRPKTLISNPKAVDEIP